MPEQGIICTVSAALQEPAEKNKNKAPSRYLRLSPHSLRILVGVGVLLPLIF